MKNRAFWQLSAVVAACFSCGRPAADVSKPSVIYGDDGRRDLYEADAAPVGKDLAKSTVALVKKSDLTASAGAFKLPGATFGASYDLCADEPFKDQPNPAFCSGFLVAPDVIATAGHCITSQADCDGVAFVFDFAYAAKGVDPTKVAAANVAYCQSVIATQHPDAGADFALVKLTRAVDGRAPVALRKSGKIADAASVIVVGHPAGLPTKVTGGATVRANAADGFFVANTDTYGGNSGSAVVNAQTREVEGILVRGENDFVARGSCMVSYRCAAGACRGEDVTRATAFAGLLGPATPVPGELAKTYAADALALAIPDDSARGATQTLAAAQAGTLTGVKVEVKIKHPYVGDLQVYLYHPDGSGALLQDRAGGSARDLAKAFDDAGSAALAAFKGKPATGSWRLVVLDRAARDVGTLDGVKLTLKSKP